MKGYKHLTKQQIGQVLETYAQTNSTRMTADRLGIKLTLVAYCLKTHGIPRSGRRETACSRNHETVLQMVSEGCRLAEIAQVVGTNRTRVREYLQQHGIERQRLDTHGENNPHWLGGRNVDPDGYVLIYRPDHPYCTRHGYVREHRLVMEMALGRYLLPSEVVHHIDGDKQNNALENLKLYSHNSDHLAEELAGHVPNWTEDGKRRISEGVRRAVDHRRKPTPSP